MDKYTKLIAQRQDEILRNARPFFEIGAAVIRIKPNSKEALEKWRDVGQRPLDEFNKLRDSAENIGIALGEQSNTKYGYLHCIDYDLRDPSKRGEADSALDRVLSAEARAFVVESGSGAGRHYYFFASEPLPSNIIGKGTGWEVVLKGNGSYVVAPGSIHPDTDKPYRWVNGKRLDAVMAGLIGVPAVALAPLRKIEPTRDLMDELIGKPERPPVDWNRLKSGNVPTDVEVRDLKGGVALPEP